MTARSRDVPPAAPGPGLAAFAPEHVAFAVAAWPMRAAEELRSAIVYRALARAARGLLPAPWPDRIRAVVDEEVRHARLCCAVGERLGAPPPMFDATPVARRVRALPAARRRAAALLAVEVAMGETISAALFRAGRRAAEEPLTRWALESILSDEIRHQQLGWSGLAALLPLLTAEERDWLDSEIAAGLAAFERQNAVPALRLLDAGVPIDPALGALGVLAPASRVEVFYEAVEQQVQPHLRRLGIDGARAWAERYRASSI